MSGRRAAFVDRDGTLMHDFHFTDSPADVVLIPGAGRALGRLNAAGIPVILVTNQSGIARGFFTMADYERVNARLETLLEADGGRLDATYVCPHHPDFSGPCACRKPGTLLFEQAAAAHDLDLAASLYVGDRFRDIEPGLALGGTGILVPTDETPPDDVANARARAAVVRTLDEAVARFLGTGA
ncbi:MAG: HAD-IIIA family hydrolase [Gemmatimonadota bacterium]|nr:HAD-IIIA family hydrolase [Gemmatimonadota bacterium]MDE3171882.1 HAD-IIIA family hydrolase [Gemmatimonadota bacterium]MDE3216649.1 HAD-IIIA family hydrolase [Gemmatimonadota bacterium]